MTAACIYKRRWLPRPTSGSSKSVRPSSDQSSVHGTSYRQVLSAEDDAKLVFGTVFSLRNMVRKLGGEDDRYILKALLLFVVDASLQLPFLSYLPVQASLLRNSYKHQIRDAYRYQVRINAHRAAADLRQHIRRICGQESSVSYRTPRWNWSGQ